MFFLKKRMRKKEIAREERLKRQKEEKQRSREKNREEKFTPPPIRLDKKERKSSFSSTTSTLRSPNRSTPSKVHKPIQRKSSFSVSPSKGLRVSWASSAATVDVDGHTSVKSVKAGSKASSLPSIKFPFDDTRSVVSSFDASASLTPIPRARNSIPRLSTSIEARAPRGDEMIAATTPDVCESWPILSSLQIADVGILSIHWTPENFLVVIFIVTGNRGDDFLSWDNERLGT
jgi:hypothetical protein